MEFNVELKGKNLQTLFLVPTFTDEDIKKIFRVMYNVESRKNVGFVNDLEKIVRKYTGCGFDPTGRLGIYQREIETFRAKADVEWCWDEFQDTIFEELLAKGNNVTNVLPGPLSEILVEKVTKAIIRDNNRLFFFGDRQSGNEEYDIVDGLFTVHIPKLVAEGKLTNIALPNAEWQAGEALEAIRLVIDKAPLVLKSLPNAMKRVFVDGLTYDAIINDLENTPNTEFGINAVINGIPSLTIKGVKVVAQYEWNVISGADFGQPNAHYILYTVPENLVIATDTRDNNALLRMYYNEDKEVIRWKARYKFGANYVHHSLMSVGLSQ